MWSLRKYFLYAVIFFVSVGCSRDFTMTDYTFGSNITPKGLISDKYLSFSFKDVQGANYADLYNFIYFQGDTVCFSFDFNDDVDKNAQVYFVDSSTGRKKTSERIEVLKSRVYGFSLAGSLLEFYRNDTLHKKRGPERKINQPFTVRLEVSSKGRPFVVEKSGEFSVSF